jgi:YVTN family beta-propeller protein
MFTTLTLAMALAIPAGDTDTGADIGGTLIVLNKSDATASFIDPGSGETWLQLPTGVGPHEVAVSPDGKTAVVADYGAQIGGNTLTVIDLTSGTVRSTVDLEANERPHGIQFVGGNSQVIVTIETRNRLLLVDLEKGRVLKSIDTEAPGTHMLVAAPDGKRAYTANIAGGSVSVIDLEQGKLLKIIETGAQCEGIDISPDGKEVWTSNRQADTVSVINTETLEEVAEIPCGRFPIRLKFTPDGSKVVVSNASSSQVAVFDAATREEVGRVTIDFDVVDEAGSRLFGDAFAGSATPIGVLITADGSRAFVAAANADVVTLLDLETMVVLGGYATGNEPDGLGWTPLGQPDPASDG